MLQRRHRRVEALCVHCGVTWVCCSVDLMVDEAAIWSPHVRPGGRLGLVGEKAGQPGRVWLKLHIGPSGVPWGVFVSKSSCWDPPHRDPPGWRGSGCVSPGSCPGCLCGQHQGLGSPSDPRSAGSAWPGLYLLISGGSPADSPCMQVAVCACGPSQQARTTCMWPWADPPVFPGSSGPHLSPRLFQNLLGGPSPAPRPKPLGLATEVGIQTCRLKYFNISYFSFWGEEDEVTQKAQGGTC